MTPAPCKAKGKLVPLSFSFDRGVPAEDRAVIRRGVRLGRRAFGVRNTFCSRKVVDVHARNGPGRLGPDIPASQFGTGIRVYTANPGWEASPYEVRLVTMLHEMYHVVQYLKSQETGLLPRWLVEGSAEWAAFWGAAREGVYPTYEAAVGTYLLDADPSQLRRAESRDGWDELDSPYGLAFRATEVLLEGSNGIERLDEFWRLLDERNTGVSFGFEWHRAFRRAFGIDVSRFYARVDRVL